ncbi:aldo/keto reductase [Serratia odorifera]|uniref:Oxidoreductase, aldo/keto reductase family protein n=2 Tax=Serratia odorifera TaxID=618 RepID=D4E323_SEROD|nr:aldo/keto reductase [Serratia odorifera]EFE95778.1 oxidoreductase, aldo/keto reductase family protein [Serratia odorifera DSM 4582]MBJ2066408.1 aldo/keto reductase [Serratia odorifera]PNK90443.1 aldo/keto reductase [Serratia odorifera]RII71612.1 aldo/keto reductase [Serratia odorifera]VDZ59555.1 putative aldo-keto reductase [Serratia odorifera]
MRKRQLGTTDIQVPPLTFGGNVFGWTADRAMSFRLLDALLDHQLNFIDTADVYSSWAPGNQGGESETVIGEWLKKSGKRDQVIIATKVGKPMGEGRQGLAPRYIQRAVEDSLRRLQTEYIDLYQSHDDDRDTPLAETLSAFDALIKAGKVRAIGASNYQAERLEEALNVSERLGLARYETLQPEYNLYARQGYEQALEGVAVKRQLGVINFFSLASGFLSGKYRSTADVGKSQRGDTVAARYLNPRGFRILAVLDQTAEKHRSTPAQIALAWLMARPSITAPIVSATSLQQLDELVGATRVQLDAQDMQRLQQASAA